MAASGGAGRSISRVPPPPAVDNPGVGHDASPTRRHRQGRHTWRWPPSRPRSGRQQETTRPGALTALVERFDPEVIDVPSGGARIRLVVDGEGEWDAVIESDAIALRRRPRAARRGAERRPGHLGADRAGRARRDGRISRAAAQRAPEPPPRGRLPRRHQRPRRRSPASLRLVRDPPRQDLHPLRGRG